MVAVNAPRLLEKRYPYPMYFSFGCARMCSDVPELALSNFLNLPAQTPSMRHVTHAILYCLALFPSVRIRPTVPAQRDTHAYLTLSCFAFVITTEKTRCQYHKENTVTGRLLKDEILHHI